LAQVVTKASPVAPENDAGASGCTACTSNTLRFEDGRNERIALLAHTASGTYAYGVPGAASWSMRWTSAKWPGFFTSYRFGARESTCAAAAASAFASGP